jgi:hypothetical protein
VAREPLPKHSVYVDPKVVLKSLVQNERDLSRLIDSGILTAGKGFFLEAQAFLRQTVASLSKAISSNRS